MLRRTNVAMDSWRSHGVTYLQSLAVSAAALQKCVKDTKSAKYGKHSHGTFFYQEPDGTGGYTKIDKVPKNTEEILAFDHKPTTTQ